MTNKHIFNGKVHFSDCFYCVNFMGVGGLQTEGGCTLSAGKIKEIWRTVRHVAWFLLSFQVNSPNEMDFIQLRGLHPLSYVYSQLHLTARLNLQSMRGGGGTETMH